MEKKKNKLDSWEEYLQEFIFFKKANGLRERTLEDYRKHVSQFFNRFPQAKNTDKLKISIYEYMGQDIKPATFNLRLVNLNAFFKWCIQENYLDFNPLVGFKRRKAESRIVNIDEETLKELISLPDKSTFSGLRDYGIILTTLDNGIRPKEIFSLLIDDINLKSHEIYVRSEVSKTKISRTLPISFVTSTTIKKLINERYSSWKNTVPVFCTAEGSMMNNFIWNDRMEFYSKILDFKIRPYDLRHAFALMYLRSGGHVFSLQKILGHTDMQMTRRYVSLTQDDLKEQHSLASPLNTLAPVKKRVRKIK
jgi:site-specific recombinase XerD